MNLWIEIARDSLIAAIAERRLPDAQRRRAAPAHRRAEPRPAAAPESASGGRRSVVAKQGEYGAALLTEEGFFALPAFPLETVVDPTGAGDSFAGGFIGYLAAQPRGRRASTTSFCAARWPTAPRWPPSTSRSSAPSVSHV